MIGIDLGTTNSLVAVMNADGPVTLRDELGDDLIPSAVAVAEDGALLVGRAAKDRLVSAPTSGRAFFKRDMGTAVSYAFGGKTWTPVECSAVVLREMKRIAELHLKQKVGSAVITVPAYFHDLQRQATMDAAKIAGLTVERLVNEPTAASLAYGIRPESDLSTVLVFDLGGGTFDVTVLECFEGIIQVKASAGESRLGGEDYTDALAAWLMNEYRWQPPANQQLRWRSLVEKLKRQLTLEAAQTILLGKNEVSVTRADFHAATTDLTRRLRPVVRRAMRDAGVTANHLDAVLLVGGASRMPVVFEVLQTDLGLPASQTLDPDRVVALGAAVQQALCARNEAVADLVMTDVCPHTLGISTSKKLSYNIRESGYFSPIIDRNTTVPVSRSERYYTIDPDQDAVSIVIYQGESRLVKDNLKIGELNITGLGQKPGQTRPGEVDVRFTYDMNGILEVEVTTLETGEKVTQVIEQRPGSLSPEQIEEAIRALKPLKIHPRDWPVTRARLERADRLHQDLAGDLRAQLMDLTVAFEAAVSSQDAAKIEPAGQCLDRFMAPFFQDE
jgi:molecular chaperone HscC